MSTPSVDMPERFICPISLQVMKGPVYCIHGEAAASRSVTPPQTPVYDFDSIYDWLQQGGVYDPLTGIRYWEVITLRPHLQLQAEIKDWCAEHGVPYEPKVWPSQREQERRRQQQEIRAVARQQHNRSAAGVAQAVWRFLFSRMPHPFDAYMYIT